LPGSPCTACNPGKFLAVPGTPLWTISLQSLPLASIAWSQCWVAEEGCGYAPVRSLCVVWCVRVSAVYAQASSALPVPRTRTLPLLPRRTALRVRRAPRLRLDPRPRLTASCGVCPAAATTAAGESSRSGAVSHTSRCQCARSAAAGCFLAVCR
jgi:hypothetical protein